MSSKKAFLILSCAVGCLVASSASAITTPIPANPPKSLCVTTATKASHAAAVAQMEKTIAPYAKSIAAEKAIGTYRQAIAMAWEAMEEPYCGFGVYGTASAKKSYGKSVERARLAFLEQVKKVQAQKTTVTTPTSAPEVKSAAKTEEPAPVAKKPEPVAAVKPIVPAAAPKKIEKAPRIPHGLSQGMHAESIKDLQRKLAETLGTPSDDDHVTGYFGPMTKELVIRFQLKKGIIDSKEDLGAGLVGPKTLAVLNAE